jgi:anti-anti-sigma factor
MNISKTHENGSIVLTLGERLDTTSAAGLYGALLPAFSEVKTVTLDFGKLEYVSSAGLRVLLLGQKEAKKNGGVMTLCGVSPEVMDVFEITGFADILTIQGRNDNA